MATKKTKTFKAPPEGWWKAANPACLATYNILENDKLLNQFDRISVPFADAPKFPLSSLAAMFPDGSTADQTGRARQLARHFFKYILELYTVTTEDSSYDGPKIMVSIAAVLLQKDATIGHLAYLTDGFMHFSGEE